MTSMKWNGPMASAKVRAAGALAVKEAAEFLLEQSNRTIPHEEGTLERSGQVTADPVRMAAVVSYDTPYAVKQHENTRLRHDSGRRAKWLERTFAEQSVRVGAFVAAAIKKAL